MLKKILGFTKNRPFQILLCPFLTLVLLFILFVTGPKRAAFPEDLTHLDLAWDEFSEIPKERKERCEKVIDIFFRLGALDIFVEPVGKNPSKSDSIYEPTSQKRIFLENKSLSGVCPGNVIVPLKGSGTDYIIVCAHFDRSGNGVGALDDMSGVLIMTVLFSALSDLGVQHNFLFVAFDLEEEGLLGSKVFLERNAQVPFNDGKDTPLGDLLPLRGNITAVVNIECIGLTLPHPWAEGSSDSLEDIFVDTGRRFGYDPSPVSINNVTADSVTFLREGIPAITICGIKKEHFSILGSKYDEPGVIDREVFFESYPILLEFIIKLDKLSSPPDTINFR